MKKGLIQVTVWNALCILVLYPVISFAALTPNILEWNDFERFVLGGFIWFGFIVLLLKQFAPTPKFKI